MKIYMSLLLSTFFFTIFLLDFALAEDTEIKVGDNILTFDEYDFDTMNNTLNYLGFNSKDRVYYTDFVETNEQGSFASVLYDGEKIIGEYIKHIDNGKEYESFVINNDEKMHELFVSEKPSVDGKIVDLPNSFVFNVKDAEIQESAVSKISNKWDHMKPSQASYFISTTHGGQLLLVGNVSNDINPDTGYGLCWAASGASIINFIRGTNYDAMGMYKRVKSYLYGTLQGDITDQKAMFDIFLLNYAVIQGKLNFSETLSYLNKGAPILCHLDYKNSDIGHVVVLCGAFKISASYGYLYMDPNLEDAYVLNYMDYSMIDDNLGGFGDYYYYSGISGSPVYTKSVHQIYAFNKK